MLLHLAHRVAGQGISEVDVLQLHWLSRGHDSTIIAAPAYERKSGGKAMRGDRGRGHVVGGAGERSRAATVATNRRASGMSGRTSDSCKRTRRS